MTREEVIRQILDTVLWTRNASDDNKNMLIDVLVEALEQEPPYKNNLGVDCISRQDVLSEIIRFSTEEGSSVECQQLYCDVNNMPSVTPQASRKGHWIADVDRWGDVVTTVNGYKCDKCNAFNSDKDNYCPNCGAKMVEPQESEDKCKNCKYYLNPDYTRCHECKAESER